MDMSSEKSGSPREATRAQILATFNRLLLESENARPGVAQIVAEAGVARSTFYDHFDGVEALFDESLSVLFGGLARCLVGTDGRERMVWWMAHIEENRRRGRHLLAGPLAERSGNLLARLLHAELGDRAGARLHSILISGTVIAALGAWVTGKLSSSPEALSDRLLATANAIREAGDGEQR